MKIDVFPGTKANYFVRITEKGKRELADFRKRDGIFPNHVHCLAVLEHSAKSDVAIKQAGYTDYEEMMNYLKANELIEIFPNL